jgi:hypothetical protein
MVFCLLVYAPPIGAEVLGKQKNFELNANHARLVNVPLSRAS